MANPGALNILQSNPLFRGLDKTCLQCLSELCVNREYAKGAVVCLQGEQGDCLFGIISGRLRVSANSPQGQEMHLNLMQVGEVFGEIALLDGRERTATVIASQTSVLFMLKRDDFLKLLLQQPAIGIHLLELVCDRVRWTSEIVEDVVFRSVPMRLARRVSILARLYGEATERGTVLRLSQADLALFLNVSRQVVNVNLGDWQRAGYVELARGAIVVRDFDGLEALAG